MKSVHRICLAGYLLLAGATTVGAGETGSLTVTSSDTITPLVELYTSEGCSSCPRADDYLTQLGGQIDKDFRAVPLAFHVDYWNWLGWKDPFSKKSYTERQRLVAEYNRQRSIYTPELVVAGKESRGGKGIVDSILSSNQEPAGVSISIDLTTSGDLQFDAAIMFDHMVEGVHAQAYIALYENDIVREIKGGENSGRTMTYNYVVRHWSDPIRVKPGQSSKVVTLALGEDWNEKNVGFAVVVVNTANGETLQSVRTPLETLFST